LEITMKRFHVHAHVEDLNASVAFYSRLFGAEPSRVESDYAKWMLDDPRVNFAISTRGGKPGVDHLGIQADDAQELAELKARALAADRSLLDEGATTCCYARSEKHWVTDPQGIAWEHFQTLDNIPMFSEKTPDAQAGGACCAVEPTIDTPLLAASVASGRPALTNDPARGKPVPVAITAAPTGRCG
jgi:catechol 2,3-dioxygenase-like lactoylglutathione lyase family enzyme